MNNLPSCYLLDETMTTTHEDVSLDSIDKDHNKSWDTIGYTSHDTFESDGDNLPNETLIKMKKFLLQDVKPSGLTPSSPTIMRSISESGLSVKSNKSSVTDFSNYRQIKRSKTVSDLPLYEANLFAESFEFQYILHKFNIAKCLSVDEVDRRDLDYHGDDEIEEENSDCICSSGFRGKRTMRLPLVVEF